MKLILKEEEEGEKAIPKLDPSEKDDVFIAPHFNFLFSNAKKMRKVYQRLKPKVLAKSIKPKEEGELSEKETTFNDKIEIFAREIDICLLYTSPSPRDRG